MSDEFLLAARSDWAGQPVAIGRMRERLRRTRWLPHALLWAELAVALLGVGVGRWFASVALETGRLVFAVSAVTMLGTLPVAGVIAFLVRRGALRWEDETPESVLRLSIRRAGAALAALRLGWWSIGLMAGFLALLWS